MRSEPVSPRIAISSRGQVALAEHAGAQRVVDVVVDVGDAVDQPHDAALERGRQVRARCGAGCRRARRSDRFRPLAVALQHVDDAQRVLVVAEAAAEALVQRAVERLLAGVAEGRMAEVVAEPDRLGQVLVQPQRARDRARDPAGLERVGEPGAVVVALGVDEDLRLVLQPAEALASGRSGRGRAGTACAAGTAARRAARSGG